MSKYTPGDLVYLKSDLNGSYPLVVEDIDGDFINVVFLSINTKTQDATLRKNRLKISSIMDAPAKPNPESDE